MRFLFSHEFEEILKNKSKDKSSVHPDTGPRRAIKSGGANLKGVELQYSV